jgi:Actin like proteins N terminal domain
MADLIVFGLDPGNSEATGTVAPSGKGSVLTIPSDIGTGSLRELTRIRGGSGQQVRLDSGECVLEVAGSSAFVGTLALEQSANASTARGDVSRYWSGHTLRLLMVLAGTPIKEPTFTLRIVTDLPVTVWDHESTVPQVQQSLCGTHSFALNGQPRRMSVEAVMVVMEGAGALAVHGLADDVPQAVIDIGGRTTELFWAQGQRPVLPRCTGFDRGVGDVGDALAAWFLTQYGRYTGEYRSVSHMIYARILEALRERRLPSYAPSLNSDGTSEAFGRRQLEHLRRDVFKELKEYDPGGIIIDRVEYTDLNAIVRALALRHRPSPDRQLRPRALILVGQKFYIKDKEQPVTWLNRLSESREYWTERLNIDYPSWEEIADTEKQQGMLQQFFKVLQVEVADDTDHAAIGVQIGELVEDTERNLASLRRLMSLFDDEAEQRPGQTSRVITKRTVARVRARLKGLVTDPEA